MFNKLINYIAKRKAYQKDMETAAGAPRLHGVNLNEWRYVGRSIIKFTYTDAKHSDDATVFFFCRVNDLAKRNYVIVADGVSSYMRERFASHPWVTNTAELWKANERDLYQAIHSEPSIWLKERMLEEHQCVWSNEKSWWVSDDAAKYESAKKTQTKKKPKEEPEILPVEDNVVKIKFKKDEETTN